MWRGRAGPSSHDRRQLASDPRMCAGLGARECGSVCLDAGYATIWGGKGVWTLTSCETVAHRILVGKCGVSLSQPPVCSLVRLTEVSCWSLLSGRS